MVTKQEQLEWLANRYELWPAMSELVIMSSISIGLLGSSWEITLEEWQQERDKMQKQQDNSWYERGEFPPVGTICEMIDDKNTWLECEIIYHRNGACIGWISSRKAPFYTYDKSEFRPLRTEREKAIDEMISVTLAVINQDTQRQMFGMLYDAGYRKEQSK